MKFCVMFIELTCDFSVHHDAMRVWVLSLEIAIDFGGGTQNWSEYVRRRIPKATMEALVFLLSGLDFTYSVFLRLQECLRNLR